MKKRIIFFTGVVLAVFLNIIAVSSAESATITVTAPPAGKICYKGEAMAINWTHQGYTGQTVDIYLRKTTWDVTLLIANAVPNTGSFSWMIPGDMAEGSYQVTV